MGLKRKKKKLSEDLVIEDVEEVNVEPPEASQEASPSEPSFDLSSMRRATVRRWKGVILVDIREFWRDKTGRLNPTKRGKNEEVFYF